jgi:type IV secretion system protein VirB10
MSDRDQLNKGQAPDKLLGDKPKGIGLNKKTFAIFGSILVGVFIIFFLIALVSRYNDEHGSDNNPTSQAQLSNGGSGNSSAASLIDKLNKDQNYGVQADLGGPPQTKTVIEKSGNNHQVVSTPQNLDDGLTPKEFSQGAKSPLSVSIQGSQNTSNYNKVRLQRNPANDETASVANAAKNALNNLSSMSASGPYGENYQQQNQQPEKTAFLQNKKGKDKFYLDSKLTKPKSPYEVKAGTIIPATLQTGIDSDLPGQITAKVSRNVYDTVTGNYLLIPQGTTVIGVYDSQVAYGQSRVLIAWSRLIFPNGDSFDLQGQPGADLAGMAGLHDLVDNHYFRIFGSALLFSVFGAAGQLSQPQQTNSVLSNQQIIYGAIGQEMSQVGAKMIQKNMNIQPTLNIRPGTQFNILLTRDMVLPEPYHWSN